MLRIKEPSFRQFTRKAVRVLTLPIRDLVTSEVKLSPIEGLETSSLETAPANEYELVSRLMKSFRAAKEEQGVPRTCSGPSLMAET
jgi:hypothetical protein